MTLSTDITPGSTGHIDAHKVLHKASNECLYSADYDTLQAAIDAAAATNKPLLLAAGTHRVASPLIVAGATGAYNAVRIRANGNATLVASGADAILRANCNIELRGVRFLGTQVEMGVLLQRTLYGTTIQDCVFDSLAVGIGCAEPYGNWAYAHYTDIQRCCFAMMTQYGIWFPSGFSATTIRGCTFWSGGGIRLDYVGGERIDNCDFVWSRGIEIHGAMAVQIRGCQFEAIEGYGVEIADSGEGMAVPEIPAHKPAKAILIEGAIVVFNEPRGTVFCKASGVTGLTLSDSFFTDTGACVLDADETAQAIRYLNNHRENAQMPAFAADVEPTGLIQYV